MKREREKIFDAICIWRRSFCRSTLARGNGEGVRGVDIVWGMFYIFLYKFWCWFWFVPCNFAALSCSCRWLICFAKWRTTWRDFVDCFALPGSGEGQGQQMIWHLHDMEKWHKVCGARQKLFALGLTRFNVVWGCFASAWKWNLHRSVWPNPSPVGQHLVSITSRGCQSSSDQMRNITQPERGREN